MSYPSFTSNCSSGGPLGALLCPERGAAILPAPPPALVRALGRESGEPSRSHDPVPSKAARLQQADRAKLTLKGVVSVAACLAQGRILKCGGVCPRLLLCSSSSHAAPGLILLLDERRGRKWTSAHGRRGGTEQEELLGTLAV